MGGSDLSLSLPTTIANGFLSLPRSRDYLNINGKVKNQINS